jgi:hypothetical protein
MNTGKFVLARWPDWIHPQQFQRYASRCRGGGKAPGSSAGITRLHSPKIACSNFFPEKIQNAAASAM